MKPARTIDLDHPALQAVPSNDTAPPDNSISSRLWQASADLAQMALESDYVQGIAQGNLNPDDYCHYSIQDFAYSSCGLADCDVAEQRATAAGQQDIVAFTQARRGRLTHTVDDLSAALRIKDASAIVPGAAAQAYIDFESNVAANRAPVYYVVAAIPCLQLWSWLSDQLASGNVPDNIYRSWIAENNDWSGAYKLENFADSWFASNAADYSWDVALEVYRGCMTGEVNFFRSACGQPLITSP